MTGSGYGIEAPPPHVSPPEQPSVRYVVLIHGAAMDTRLARLFLADRRAVAEFDAGAPEVRMMIDSLAPQRSAASAEWDLALGGHSALERAEAEVYTLDV
jgi:hypothetical protein